MNSVDLMEQKSELVNQVMTICGKCKTEIRSLSDEEKATINEIREKINNINEELRKINEVVELPEEIKNNNTINSKKITMNQNFSLLSAIRNVAENKVQDNLTQEVINKGAEEMRAAGVNYVGQIQLPMEARTITVATEGADTVATELMDVLAPLRAKNVLIKSGARFLSGLKGDIQYPLQSAVTASWESETATVTAQTPTYSSIKLSPKRMAVTIPVSKQFLLQDSVSAEQTLRQDIFDAINTKLEATILGHANTSGQPQGLFYTATSLGTISDFGDVTAMEASIEGANFDNFRYVCTPGAKAKLRNMLKGAVTADTDVTVNVGGMVYENNEIDGVPCLSTSNIDTSNGILCGDFSNLVIAQWGDLDLTVDIYTGAASGIVYLTVNSFWDAQVLRSGAFVAKVVA